MGRIPYVGKEQLDEDHRELVESHTVRPGEPLHIRQALANDPELLRAFHEYGAVIRGKSGLSERQREVVVLTVAHHLRSRYIWQQHVTFAHDDTLSDGEMRAITDKEYAEFDDDVRSLIEYTVGFTSMSVTDELHRTLVRHYTAEEVVGIGLLIMNYVALAHGAAGFGVEIEHDEFVGWNLENL